MTKEVPLLALSKEIVASGRKYKRHQNEMATLMRLMKGKGEFVTPKDYNKFRVCIPSWVDYEEHMNRMMHR